MSGQNYKVKPRSWADIETIANNVREIAEYGPQKFLPVVDLAEYKLHQLGHELYIHCAARKELNGAEGITIPSQKQIILADDVYAAVNDNDPSARFTLAHELGHYFLHPDLNYARARKTENLKPYELSEPQANHFASCLLIPTHFLADYRIADKVMRDFGVSRSAAAIALTKRKKR